jgi:carbon-monoxide dehydrogenase medium subunit
LTTALAEDEIILDVRFPAWPAGRRWAFREFSRRTGDFALAGVALFFDLDARQRACNAHIGVVGACQYSRRLRLAERALEGRRVDAETGVSVAQVAAEEADPSDDVHASAEYRKSLVATLLEEALRDASTGNGLKSPIQAADKHR